MDEKLFVGMASFGGIFDGVSNLCRLIQDRSYGTIFLFRETDSIFKGFARNLATHAIIQLDFGVDGRRIRRAFRLGTDFNAGKRLALLAQDVDDVRCRASAEADQD